MVSVLVSSGTLCFFLASVTAGKTGFSGKIKAPGIFELSKKGSRNYSVIFYLWDAIFKHSVGDRVKAGKTAP